jgi:hypothetical protein
VARPPRSSGIDARHEHGQLAFDSTYVPAGLIGHLQARLFELLPGPPLTTSQVALLKADNVASGALPGFRELNIQPKAVEEIVSSYIGRLRAPDPVSLS